MIDHEEHVGTGKKTFTGMQMVMLISMTKGFKLTVDFLANKGYLAL